MATRRFRQTRLYNVDRFEELRKHLERVWAGKVSDTLVADAAVELALGAVDNLKDPERLRDLTVVLFKLHARIMPLSDPVLDGESAGQETE